MRRRIKRRTSAPIQTPEPVIVEEIDAEVVENAMPFVIENEEEIINYIKEKATKATLTALAPLLEKLEQAVQEHDAHRSAVAASQEQEPAPMNYEAQLKKLQESSMMKVKEKELKIAERMNKLQVRFANIRK